MSSSDMPSLTKWRLVAALLAALSTGGCFEPLYGEAAHPGLAADMRAIAVEPIKDRIGHYLGNDLIMDLNGTGVAPPPKYRLTVTTSVGSQTPTVSSQIQAANAATVTATANYKLTLPGGGDEIVSGQATAVAVYDRTEDRFANLRAERDAEIKLAKALADEIELRLAARLAVRMGPIRGADNNCITSPKDVTAAAARLNYSPCDGSDEQQWTLRDGALIGKDGRCLAVADGGASAAAVLEARACEGGAAGQKWSIAGGAIVGAGDRCIEIPQDQSAKDAPIQVRQCDGGTRQKLEFLAPGPPQAGLQ